MTHKPNAHQSEFEIQHSKYSNSFLMIPILHKHFSIGIVVGLEVNLHKESSLNKEPDAMCKIQLLPKWQKVDFTAGHLNAFGCSKTMQGTKTNLPTMQMAPKASRFNVPQVNTNMFQLPCQLCSNPFKLPPKPSRHLSYK